MKARRMGWKPAVMAAALASTGCVTGGARFVGVENGVTAGERFGGSGYYWLAPDAEIPDRPAADGDLTAHGTLARKPEGLAAHPVPAAGAAWRNELFHLRVARPAGAEAGDGEPVRIGGLSVRMDQRGEVDGLETIYAKVLSFTLAGDAPFRLGVMVDAFDQIGAYAPDYVVIREEATGRTWHNMPSVVRDGRPDLMLFDLRGPAGAVYSVELHRAASAEGLPITGLSALTFDAAGPDAPAPAGACAAVGEFSRAGEYMKDYFVFKDGDTFHLFYNVGRAGPVQDWKPAGNEKAFGHATSKDLKTWTHHPRVLEVVPGTWEGMVVSAPSILKHDGLYYMVYTGFDDRWYGMQTIGLATSRDLFTWERHPANPVYRAPAWARTNPNAWENCRDAHIIRHDGEFLLYTMVEMKDGKGAIALASSKDAVHWEDHGPALITAFGDPESPRVFEHNGTFYMFATSGHGRVLYKTKTPKSNKWEPVPFNWPANIPGAAMGQPWAGIWSGWEVTEHEGRLVFSAFLWKPHGGYIKFWDVTWDGDVPTVIYEK